MSNTIDFIKTQVDEFNESIKQALNSKKISNTGEAARSLRIETGYDFVKSLGIFYIEFLDTGRGKANSGSGGAFLLAIKKWLRTKHGVTQEPQLTIAAKRVVYFINKLGTQIYRDNKKGIELSKKVTTLRQNIDQGLGKEVKAEVLQVLDRFKKKYELNL